MMIDTETRLCGEAANEFCNMLTSVDLNSINARDEFISDVLCQFDEQGIMSIDISDLDIDLSIMDEDVNSFHRKESYGTVLNQR